MPKFNVEKSIVIDAPIEKVHEAVSDFHHWPTWSPWLIQEPGVEVNVREDGKYYDWTGDRVGQGNMTVTQETSTNLKYDLEFLKPWKSQAKVGFNLKEVEGGTEAAWSMASSLPFFMFWMKKMMVAYIGNDYSRGLLMLKDFVEKGQVDSKLEFDGAGEYAGCQYVGIKRECSIDEAPEKMEEDYGRLFETMNKYPDHLDKDAFSIYKEWDFVKNRANFISCMAVKSVPDGLPSDFITDSIPATKTWTITHRGAYRHMGNAWSTMYNLHQNKVFKPRKDLMPFELYVSDPRETPEAEIVTQVIFPVK